MLYTVPNTPLEVNAFFGLRKCHTASNALDLTDKGFEKLGIVIIQDSKHTT